YKVLPSLKFGFSYRNRVSVEGSGTTTTQLGAMPMKMDARQSFTNPHAFRAGAALSLMDERLLLAADVKYLLYAEAYKEIKTVTISPTGSESASYRPTHWKNAFTVQLGGEYKVNNPLRLRLGYILSSSATPEKYAQQFMAPPGYA